MESTQFTAKRMYLHQSHPFYKNCHKIFTIEVTKMNNVTHYPKVQGFPYQSPPISTVSQPEIVLIRTDDFRPSKLTVRLIVCLFRVSTSGLTSGMNHAGSSTSCLTSDMNHAVLYYFPQFRSTSVLTFLTSEKSFSSSIRIPVLVFLEN